MVASSLGVSLHPDFVNPKEVLTVPPETYCYNCRTGSWHRRITAREGALIQTFPSDFKFAARSIGEAYRMVGNAVPPQLAKAVATALKAALDKQTERRQAA